MERKLTNQEWAVLVNKAQQGDEDGFEELYRASYNYLYAVCLNGNVPEENIPDVLQEAYIKIFKNIGSLADPEKFLSWASTVVRNTGRDKGRSQKIYYERNEFMEEISTDENAGLDAFAVDELDPGYNPGVALEKAAIVQIVRDMIAELPDTQRDCILLWCEDRNMKDISEELGIPVGSVKSSINYAKQKIKKMTLRIEKEQGIRLHTVAPMSFFIWAVRNMQDLIDVAPGDFAGIREILTESGQIVTDSVAKVANSIRADAKKNILNDTGREAIGRDAPGAGRKAAEQTASGFGKAAEQTASGFGKAAEQTASGFGKAAEQTASGFGKKAAAGFAQTAVAKAAVAGLILVIGSGALYFGLKGKEPQETVAETAVQEQAAEDNRESETASLQTDGAEAEGMAQAVTEAEGEQEWVEPEEPTEVPEPEEQETERNLLDQIPELDGAVAEMVPTIKSYIDTVRKHGNREFSVNDAEQYWGFVHVYCIRQPNYFSDDMYLGVVSRGEIEEASRAAFPDFTGIPDTLDEYGPSKWTESGVDEDTVRMPLGNSQEYYQMSEWSRTDDGNGIDVTIDVYYVPDDSWWTSYTVHLIPVREAVENDARLKFFITGIEED